MRIAVDTRSWRPNEMPELRNFTTEVFSRLVVKHTNHEFIFLTDTALDAGPDLPKNVTTVAITPAPANFLLYKWWYDVKVPRALKKYKVDVFIATYGLGSLTTSVAQVLIVKDLAFLQKKWSASVNNRSYYKRFTPLFIKKAKRTITLSDFIKDELVNVYSVDKEAIQTVGSGGGASFKPANWEEREVIKERFSAGCEYFVFINSFYSSSNFLKVLKAFSIFKKWQKTNMKLVIAGRFDAVFEKEFEKLSSYKYRDDVMIRKDLSEIEMAQVVTASYAMIFPSFYEGFAAPVLEALTCGVPVITTANSSMNEIAADAALYADFAKPEDVSNQMKKIFKDEQLRNQLIEAGKLRSQLYSWDTTAALLWEVIEQVVSK